MKSFIISTTILLCSISSILQAADMRKMSNSQRKEYLINTAIEVTKNFGPEWYAQGTVIPEIADSTKLFEDSEADTPEMKEFVGRRYYRVTLRFDDATRKKIRWRFASYVDIWADDGEPKAIIFGHNYGLHFLTIPYREWIKAGVLKEEQIKFRKMNIPDVGFPRNEKD